MTDKKSPENQIACFDEAIVDLIDRATAWTSLGDKRAAEEAESCIVKLRALAVRCGLPLPDIRKLRERHTQIEKTRVRTALRPPRSCISS